MADNGKDRFVAWLNDAYAMEKSLIPILENHAKDAEHDPATESRIRQHVEETRRHADLVENCLDRLGESPSAVKTTFMKMTGAIQSVATGMFGDELIKNALSDYATEHFEIAAYTALQEGAQALGYQDIAETCGTILRDERDMAAFLERNLPQTVRQSLQEAMRG